jgi:acyl carrier protein
MTVVGKAETEIDLQKEARIREIVLRALSDIAPEVDVAALDPSVDLRDQMDIDSVDFLNFVIRLHNELKIDIPDADMAKLATLDGCIKYSLSKVGRGLG